MRSEWPVVRLGDHCTKIGSGATPKGGKEAYLDAGPYRLIRSQNVYNEGFAWQGLAFISEEQARRLDGVSVQAGDVLVNITGDSVARVCTAPATALPARVNQHVAIVRPRDTSFDADFLRWYLCAPEQQEKLLGLASAGATRNALTKGMLEGLTVPKPSMEMQRELVAPLVAIERRIDLLRQTNATLESIAQALFKSWFIDFDPVRAKAEGREPEGMDAATAALFPAEFEASALGLIPKGWAYRSADELFDVGIGKTPPRKEPHWFSEGNGDVRWLSIKDMGDEGTIASRSSEFLSDEAVAKFNVRVVPTHTVLMSFKLTVGRLSITDGPMCTNEAIAHFKARVDSPQFTYLYCYLKAFDFRTLGSTSSIADATNSKAVKALPLLVPSRELVSVFHRTVEELFGKMYVQKAHWRRLEELRDCLLPRLISGKLRLPEAQAQLEEAIA